jgi:hypothetical protein
MGYGYGYGDLTAKQQKLIDGLMNGLPKAEAYRLAYPDTKIENYTDQVNKMISNSNGKFRKFSVVYAEMEKKAREQAETDKEKSIATRVDVIKFLSDGMQGLIKDTVLKTDKNGNVQEVGVTPPFKDREKCAEALAKYYGLMTDKIDLNGGVTVVIGGEDELEE